MHSNGGNNDEGTFTDEKNPADKGITGELGMLTLILKQQEYDLTAKPEEYYKKGLNHFAEVFEGLSGPEKRFILTTQEGEMIQLVYLGLKPAMSMDEESEDGMSAVQRFPGLTLSSFTNGDDIVVINEHLVNISAAREVISSMPSIFGENETPQNFFENTYPSNKGVPGNTIKLGLLLGYPYDAACEHNTGMYEIGTMLQLEEYPGFADHASEELKIELKKRLHPQTLKDLEVMPFEKFDRLEDELFALAEKIGFEDLGRDEIMYVLKRREMSAHGLSFVAARDDVVKESQEYLEKIASIYESSGMKDYIDQLTIGMGLV